MFTYKPETHFSVRKQPTGFFLCLMWELETNWLPIATNLQLCIWHKRSDSCKYGNMARLLPGWPLLSSVYDKLFWLWRDEWMRSGYFGWLSKTARGANCCCFLFNINQQLCCVCFWPVCLFVADTRKVLLIPKKMNASSLKCTNSHAKLMMPQDCWDLKSDIFAKQFHFEPFSASFSILETASVLSAVRKTGSDCCKL